MEMTMASEASAEFESRGEPLSVTLRLPGGGRKTLSIKDETDLAWQLGVDVPSVGFSNIVSVFEGCGYHVVQVRDLAGAAIYNEDPAAAALARPRNWRMKAIAGALIAVTAGWMVMKVPTPKDGSVALEPVSTDPALVASSVEMPIEPRVASLQTADVWTMVSPDPDIAASTESEARPPTADVVPVAAPLMATGSCDVPELAAYRAAQTR